MMLKYARQDEGRNDQCTRAWMGVQFISRALSGEDNKMSVVAPPRELPLPVPGEIIVKLR
jgi:hypothetical protein